MDEIARDDRLPWSKQDNKMYGVCFQHSYKYSMDLNEIDDAKRVQELLNTDSVHKTTDNLVVADGNVGNGGHIKPLLTLPSCCKSFNDQFE